MLDTGWMRIVAWNGNWKSKRSTVEAQVAAVCALHADVAIFSEWSPNETRKIKGGATRRSSTYLRGALLDAAGFPFQCSEHESNHQAMDDIRRLYWGQLAAATRPIVKASTVPPTFAAGSWLEFRHAESDLTLIGVRLPDWQSPLTGLRRDLWEWMVEQFDRLAGEQAIVMGDFNTWIDYGSSKKDRRHGSDHLRSLTALRGWQDPYAVLGRAAEPTYFFGTAQRRLDYAFVSPAFTGSVEGIQAPCVVGDVVMSGPAKSAANEPTVALSDHAPLVLDVSPTG